MYKTGTAILALCLFIVCSLAVALPAQAQPTHKQLGKTSITLAAPVGHSWVNPKTELALNLLPKRYKGLAGHAITIFSYSSLNSLMKLYNNYCTLFYIGKMDKSWSQQELQELKEYLLVPKGKILSGEVLDANSEYLHLFLENSMDFSISSKKAKKYYSQLQDHEVLLNNEHGLVLSLRIKKAGEKTKYVFISLTLVKDKLLGTVYYQVRPGSKERERAATLTKNWQKSILQANM